MLDNSDQVAPGDIAIVGMALRVPGARNIGEFWQNLRSGTESIRTLTARELAEAGESADRIHHPNYVPRTADLPDMEMFDADFFGLSPKEAAIMDPQHRQFLECTWEAMEDAGRMPDTVGGPVGVFAGCGMGSYFYFNVCSNRQLIDQVGMFLLRHTGNDKDFLATRASFTFDLRGPSVNVQTACSTSLVAVHYACQSLLNGECDMALAGGVTIEFPHRRGYMFQEGEILSPDGSCRAFDHRAAGTVFGSGVGVVVLRRLADAIGDGDIIHAVIKSSSINNDGGAKAGYLAPSVTGQAEAIIEAQGLAGVSADSIQYVECHGTGTFLGDPIEIEALTQAFRQNTARAGFCRVGSVKSNIGHLDTAAGVVGLIKTALAIKYGEIPPTLGFERPNPSIDFASSPFVVNSHLTCWPHVEGRRRAAVNSLGVGGTNAHAIVEQAPYRFREHVGRTDPVLLLLSAKHRKSLDDAAARLATRLSVEAPPALDDMAYTLLTGRRRFEHNRLIAVRSHDDAIAALADPNRAFQQTTQESTSGAVFLFPGGGAQHAGMAAVLYRESADVRATIDEGLSYLPAEASRDIRSVWFGSGAENDAPTKTFLRPSIQLPAILILEIAIARMWISSGVNPSALVGHSMGENAAACVAGVISFRDTVNLVRLRGELFDTIEPGGMLSVPVNGDELAGLLPPELDIASINAPGLSVVSGRNGDLDTFQANLAERGIESTRIPIEIAAHSRMLDVILPRWEAFLRSITLSPPSIPIISNRSGKWLSAEEATDPLYWVGHLRSAVKFADGLATLSADPRRIYIEVGPGRALSSLAKAQGTIDANQVINSLPHANEQCDDRLHFLCALGRAYVAGLPVDASRFWGGGVPNKVTLPTYAFQHRRYFIDQSAGTDVAADEMRLEKEPDITRWGYRQAWKKSLADYVSGAEATPSCWLFFLDEAGAGARMVARLRDLGHRVVTVSLGDAFIRRSSDEYLLCAELGRPGYDALLSGLAADGVLPSRIVHMWLLTQEESFRPGSNFFHRNQECGFYSLLYLAQALGEVGSTSDLHFTVVTNGVQRVGQETVHYPEKATVFGPALVLSKEMSAATVKLIDVVLPVREASKLKRWASRASLQKEVGMFDEMLWEDLVAAPASEVVTYRHGNRWSRVYERLTLASPDECASRFKQKGVYLFTGGLGDIPLVIAAELARRFSARLILVGRTVLPPREDWQSYLRQHSYDAVKRGIDAIASLEALGAEVLYLSADVSNLQQMADAVQTGLERFGKIDAVFHAAGVVDDGLIQTKSLESIENVLAPKLLGTAVIDSVFRDVPIDMLVLFSSTSTDTAPAGQVDYVAANSYLNAFAENCRARTDRTTVALHWGVWSDVGLAARALGSADSILLTHKADDPARGPIFEHWTEDENGVVWLEAVISPKSHWMLDEHRLVSGQSVLPGTAYIELIAQAAREHGLPFAGEIRDLVFLKALAVADDERRAVRVRFEKTSGGYHVLVVAGNKGEPSSFEKHAEAFLSPQPQIELQVWDIARVASRCSKKRNAEPGSALRSAQDSHIRFGPRWSVLRSTALGHGEAVAELELGSDFRADTSSGILMHPALLDIATGFAMELVEGYDRSGVLWAPVSYGQVVLHRPLPDKILSWVRLADNSEFGDGYAVFDILIADADGNVIVSARRLVVKRLNNDVHLAAGPAHSGSPTIITPARSQSVASAAMLKLAAQVRLGISRSEGFDALQRALATGETQPIVSSMDLYRLRERAARVTDTSAASAENFERPNLDVEFVAPLNAVETTLASFWQELLGVSKVGVHDNFFDMGGHSLIAVRLFRMIKKQYGLDLPISVLFEAPTIFQCAALIAAQVPAAMADNAEEAIGSSPVPAPKRTHLVTMHAGKNANATPLFICAGMFGNVLNLRHLALRLGSDRTIYGLQARGLYGELAPHETFEEMARDYVAEIRSVRPHGPYLLAGYSGGGITAYEIARQLTEAGEVVTHVLMFDTPQPTQPALDFWDRGRMKLQDLRRYKLGFVRKWLQSRVDWEIEKRQKREAENLQGNVEQFNNEKIEKAFRQALLCYDVKPYAGKVTVFRPKPAVFYRLSGGRCLQQNRNILLEDNGWSDHVADLRVVEVPGDHDSMMLEPYVRILAECTREAIVDAPLEFESQSRPANVAQPRADQRLSAPLAELA
jgi:acyl transferase domain-containing protein/thioesterase domain-containing protein